MTKEEFIKITTIIKGCYPWANMFQDENILSVWYAMIGDLEYNPTSLAVKKHIMSNATPPSVADIRRLTSEMTHEPVADWGDEWEQVLRLVRRHGYVNENLALEEMSEITRRCVKRIGWQNICHSEKIAVDRANFREMYEELAKRDKADKQIPPKMLDIIDNIRITSNDKKQIGEKGNE